jgi:YHS domain-containing protein
MRLAAAGGGIPVSKGGPPTSVFPGDRLPPPGTVVTCPVCGDEFAIEDGRPLRHYKGKVVVFCCKRCLPHFDKNPDMFVGPGI